MTKENKDGTKKQARRAQQHFNVNYSLALRMVRGEACVWCQGTVDPDGINNGDSNDVGEFWNKTIEDSFLGHPDCSPNGLEPIQAGTDPEWSMA